MALSLTDPLSFLERTLTPLFSKVVVAVIVSLVGFIIARIAGKFVQRILSEIELNTLIKKATGIKIKLEQFTGTIVTYLIYFITIVMAMDVLELTPIIVYILSGGIIIVIILAVLLAIKDFIPNFIAGLVILKRKAIVEGNYIKTDAYEGRVILIDLLETRIKTKSGDEIYIPNSLMLRQKILKKKR